MSINFKSNNCVGIKVNDLQKAEHFYGTIMGFAVVERSDTLIAYNTGNFTLYIEQNENIQLPVPSFTVENAAEAKNHLLKNGCEVTWETDGCFWFKDPFGMTYDVIEKC